MEENISKPKKKIDFGTYAIVVGFLCFEVLAFVSFYLGHSFILYGILSIVLAALLLLVTFRQIKKDGITTFAFFLFPVFVFGLLTALSSFNYSSIGAIGVAESVFVPIALTFFALAGFLTGYLNSFKMKTALMIIYSALGLFVLINLFITMIYYVPFYTLIYKNSYIVYNGKPSVLPIGKMAYMLFGFKIEQVKLEYFTLFPSILATSVIPLFFMKFKENKRDFAIFLTNFVIAALSLLFTISRVTMVSDIVLVLGIAIIVLTGKIVKSRPILDGFFMVLGIVVGLVLIVMFINAQTSWSFVSGFRNMIASVSLLNRVFNTNGLAKSINVVFQDLFYGFKLFGVPVGGYAYQYDNGVAQDLSGYWIIDNLMTSGLFGALFFLGALIVGIRRMFIYIKKCEDDDLIKFTMTGFILGFLVIAIFLQDPYPLVNSYKIFPFFTSAPLLIVLFLLGYMFNKTLTIQEKQEADKVPAAEEKPEMEVDDHETISL